MLLVVALLINNLALFFIQVIGYHVCHSVVMLLDGYFHLCQAILCTVRIVSQRIQFTFTSRHTYGLARVGVVGELVAFISFLSLSISVFLETVKHLIDIIFVLPKQETNSSTTLTAHGSEHIHSIIDHPNFILGVGLYATISNCLLGAGILYKVMERSKEINEQIKQRRPSLKQPLPKDLVSQSLLITDSLPAHHAIHHVLNMMLGPIAIFICGVLLVVLSETYHVRVLYSRLVDPSIGCLLFLSYLFMIYVPIRDVVHLVLQAKPTGLKSDEIEKTIMTSIPGVERIHNFHVWRLTPHKAYATIHVVFNTTNDLTTKYQDISFIFQTYRIQHVTIQPEFVLSSKEIEDLGCQDVCSKLNQECSLLRCCEETQPVMEHERSCTTTASKTCFHRRSSIDLHSTSSDSETETDQVN